MRKNYLLCLLLILLVFFGVYSCRKENNQSESESLTDPNAAMDKDQAQNYYYNSLMKQPGTSTPITNGITTMDVNTTAKKNWKYLMFNLSYTSQTPNVTFIEIPLRYNSRPSTLITKDAITAVSPAQLNILNASYDRLLIYKNKSTGQVDQTIVTFIPDSAYLQKHHNDISSNHIDKLDVDFNGFLLYKKWDGTPTYLLTIHNGVYTNNYNFSTTPPSVNNVGKLKTDALQTNDDGETCVGYWDQPMVQQCYASDPEGDDEVCSEWVPDGPAYWVNLYCYEDGSSPTPPPNPPPPGTAPAPPAGSTPVVVSPPPVDPCAQKAIVSTTEANATIASQNAQILAKSTTDEYGTNQNLTSLTGGTYINTPITTDASTDSFTPTFTWDSTNGYTIGSSHGHPGGSAPSPDDVFTMIDNLTNTNNSGTQNLIAAGASAIQFYKYNASITVVTAAGNYVVTVDNWATLQTLFTTYNANPATFDADYQSKGQSYLTANPGASSSAAGAFALMSIFGSSINLYQAPAGSTTYVPLTINSSNQVATLPCSQ